MENPGQQGTVLHMSLCVVVAALAYVVFRFFAASIQTITAGSERGTVIHVGHVILGIALTGIAWKLGRRAIKTVRIKD